MKYLVALLLAFVYVPTNADCNDDAETALRAGQIEQSIAILTLCLTNDLQDIARTRLLLGQTAIRQGRSDVAVEHLNAALEARPEYAIAIAYRGYAHWLAKDRRQAEVDFEQALTLDSELAYAWYFKGEMAAARNRRSQAIEHLSHAITYSTDSRLTSRAAVRRAQLLAKKRQHAAAREDLARAIAADPNNVDAYFERARQLERDKDQDAALADYTRAIELDPDHAPAYLHRAAIYRKRKLYHLAIDDYDRAIEIDPGYAKAHTNRAITYIYPLLPVLLVLALG